MTLSKRGWEGMDLPHTAPKSRSLAALGMTRGERAIVTSTRFHQMLRRPLAFRAIGRAWPCPTESVAPGPNEKR